MFFFSLYIAKTISFLISILQLGQSSTLPGKTALKLKKDLLQCFKLSPNCRTILITGTNGKSTTCGILANILKSTGKKVAYNKSGANLLSGIATAFSTYADLLGRLNHDYIVLEVDEATLPIFTAQIKADVIAVTNFFRDQLDRFGELDSMAKLIEKGINNNPGTIVILNADDVRVAYLKTNNKKIYYGLEDKEINSSRHPLNNKWALDPEEVTICPNCLADLIFTNKFLSHLGSYKCSICSLKRPVANFLACNIKRDSLSTNFDIISNDFNHQSNNFFISQIGIFNLYNALCAITISKVISSATHVQTQKALQSYTTIFGRGEKIKINNKTAWIYLIKNPTGTTEVLKTLSEDHNSRFLIAINDNFADGRDISWLWDAGFDVLSTHHKNIFVSGKRADDMALRLKYANIKTEQIKINKSIAHAITDAHKSLAPEETLYILPTYTVLLEMQKKKICKPQPL